MKNKKILCGYIILFVLFIISVLSIIFFENKGSSVVINLVFDLIMVGILAYVMRSIRGFVSMINDLKTGTEYLELLSPKEIAGLKDGASVFPSNKKLSRLLSAYYRDNSGFDGDIADYISDDLLDEQINKHISELAAGVMTGLGLLGTFVGLMIGIKDLKINQDQLMESIKTLMDGMKTAFLTSIFGVIYSLYFNAYYKHIYSWGEKELNNFYEVFYSKVASNPDNKNINRIMDNQNRMMDNQNRQIEEFEKLPSAVAAALAEEINKVFTPTVNKMDTLMEQFVSVATSNQQESLAILVNSFVDNMNEVLNDKFVMLSETLDKTCELQTANFEMMDKVVSTISSQTSHLSDLNDSIEKSLDNIQNYESQLEKFNDSIIEHNTESNRLISEVLESQNNTHIAVQNFTENISNTTSYINQVKDVIDGQINVIDEFSSKSIEIINYNASTLEKINTDNAETLSRYCDNTNNAVNALNDQISEFTTISGNLINEIRTVGSRIHTECDGLESSLGSSLNSTFKVFDDNLAEITTHLNSSIKEMQELVDRIPRDLYLSIGKLKDSMENCVSLLNNYSNSTPERMNDYEA